MIIVHKNNTMLQDRLKHPPKQLLDKIPTDKQLDNLPYISTNAWQHWQYFTCAAIKYIHKSMRITRHFIGNNITKIKWTDECLEYICGIPNVECDLIQHILTFSTLSLTSLTLCRAYGTMNKELIILHNMPITPECILAASKYPMSAKDLIKELSVDYQFQVMIQIREFRLNDILQFTPTQEHVKLACTYQRIDLIQHLLNYRLSVDAECFELMFFTNIIDEENTEIALAIETFIIAGYQLTYEDVIRLARRGHYVNDLKRFNFTITDELITTCIMNYVTEYDLPYTIESLRFACMGTMEHIVEHIIDYGITPDKQCLINAVNSLGESIVHILIPYITLDAELTHMLITKKYISSTSIKY